MNYLKISTGDDEFTHIIIAQRVKGGKWYATAKDLSGLLQYSQTRRRAFLDLRHWVSGKHVWVELASLTTLLIRSTPVFRKDIILTLQSRVKSCTKHGIRVAEYVEQEVDTDARGNVLRESSDGRIIKPSNEPIEKHDPEIEAWIEEIRVKTEDIRIIHELIKVRQDELNSDTHINDVRDERDAHIGAASILDKEFKRLKSLRGLE